MAQKNRHLYRGRISKRKFRDLLRLFALDITADRAAILTGLHHNTSLVLYRLLRGRMAELARADCPFRGQVEIDESYFGPAHTRGHRGRGNPRKVPVFGILERGGRVHCQIVKNCSKTTLHAIISGQVKLSAEIITDGFRSYDGLVEAGFVRHHRINKYYDRHRTVFPENGVHINGIESFWSFAKRRHQKFNGLRRSAFPTFRKETEFRFNTRSQDLYKWGLSRWADTQSLQVVGKTMEGAEDWKVAHSARTSRQVQSPETARSNYWRLARLFERPMTLGRVDELTHVTD